MTLVRFLKSNRVPIILAALALAIALSQLICFWLRFSLLIEPSQYRNLLTGIIGGLLIKIPIFVLMRLHRGWWSYVGVSDILHVLWVNFVSSIAFAAIVIFYSRQAFPRSIYILDFIICFLIIFLMRIFVQIQREIRTKMGFSNVSKYVLLYGAGWAGANLARELQLHIELGLRILGFVEEDEKVRREGKVIGIPVLGRGEDLPEICERFRNKGTPVDEILVAMPSASGAQMRAAVAHCQRVGIPCKTLPSLHEILGGRDLSLQIRRIMLEDLLGREPVELDETRIRETLSGKTVLVTGAAGSIGSELCRQIAAFLPARLVLLDQGESPLYSIDMEMRTKFPAIEVIPEVVDIRNYSRLLGIYAKHGVQIVYHAAAYKHVPLMEANVTAAIENNVLGTDNVARAALEARVEAFVMISSDKAVNPTNVMGATKRAAELLVAALNQSNGGPRFVSVRFGNVLGSNGSVVPLFQQQIERGGPVTVTHPDVRRFFMLTREAAQLVLQASSMGKGGEIFVLEMGNAVKIVDLARNMIQLAGLKPDVDVPIKFTGLRPGEKLYEEVITEGESIRPTHHEKIKIFHGPGLSPGEREQWLARSRDLVDRQDSLALVEALKEMIPEYVADESWSKL